MAGVTFSWPGGQFGLSVPRFELQPGDRLLLLGPSGSGKSTFLNLMSGIVAPQSGRLDILGTNLGALGASARDRFRAEHMGIVFQMFNLLPYASVLSNVTLPLKFAPERRQRVAQRGGSEEEARRLLTSLGLPAAESVGLKASQLSVGQQQRVAAARALIGRPELIIADEPTSALDRNRQQAFLDLLFAEVSHAGSALVMVSHDESLAGRFDRVEQLANVAVVQRKERPS